jgi:uncharacterized protein (TIGR03067 family)
MRRSLLLSALLVVLVLPLTAAAEGPRNGKIATTDTQKTDQDLIQGRWEIVSCEEYGKPMPFIVGAVWEFRGDKYEEYLPSNPQRRASYRFQLDSKANPKQFDSFMPGFPKIRINGEDKGDPEEIAFHAIYSLESDTLQVLFAVDHKPRPRGFDAASVRDASLWVLKRVKEQ